MVTAWPLASCYWGHDCGASPAFHPRGWGAGRPRGSWFSLVADQIYSSGPVEWPGGQHSSSGGPWWSWRRWGPAPPRPAVRVRTVPVPPETGHSYSLTWTVGTGRCPLLSWLLVRWDSLQSRYRYYPNMPLPVVSLLLVNCYIIFSSCKIKSLKKPLMNCIELYITK